MGDEFFANPDNPRGFFEHAPIVQLNEEILAAAGGTWQNPPSVESVQRLGTSFDNRIKTAVSRMERGALQHGMTDVGFKDPRMCLVADLWHPHLTNPRYICCFRDLNEVGRSLEKLKGDRPPADGYACAHEYTRRALSFLTSLYLD